ncbi:MAG: energy transducer TonB [Clostridium sp.]|nr:energy transducer TonB [Clostridium sp.]
MPNTENSSAPRLSLLPSLLAAAAMLFSGGAVLQAQNPVRVTLTGTSSASSSSEVYVSESVDIPPSFPGGDAAMMRFINAERRYPREAYERAVEGRVLCSFVVEPSGELSNIELVRGVERSLNEEALRIVSQMPDWEPGLLRGSAVRVYCIIPIPFRR